MMRMSRDFIVDMSMVRVSTSVPIAVTIVTMPASPVRVPGPVIMVVDMPGGTLFQSADNLVQKLRQLLPLLPGKRGKEGIRAFSSDILIGCGSGGTPPGDGNKKIALVLLIMPALNKTAMLQFAQNFAQGGRTDIEHFLKLTLVHGFSALEQGEHTHLRMFRVSVMVMGAGHKFDGPVEKHGQIFTACAGCLIIFAHFSFLLLSHTRPPCRKRETPGGNVCRTEGIGWKSPRESRHTGPRASSRRLAGVPTDHVHARVRGNGDEPNDGVLQKIQTYGSPYVI
jgi:hypothetical protein